MQECRFTTSSGVWAPRQRVPQEAVWPGRAREPRRRHTAERRGEKVRGAQKSIVSDQGRGAAPASDGSARVSDAQDWIRRKTGRQDVEACGGVVGDAHETLQRAAEGGPAGSGSRRTWAGMRFLVRQRGRNQWPSWEPRTGIPLEGKALSGRLESRVHPLTIALPPLLRMMAVRLVCGRPSLGA